MMLLKNQNIVLKILKKNLVKKLQILLKEKQKQQKWCLIVPKIILQKIGEKFFLRQQKMFE